MKRKVCVIVCVLIALQSALFSESFHDLIVTWKYLQPSFRTAGSSDYAWRTFSTHFAAFVDSSKNAYIYSSNPDWNAQVQAIRRESARRNIDGTNEALLSLAIVDSELQSSAIQSYVLLFLLFILVTSILVFFLFFYVRRNDMLRRSEKELRLFSRDVIVAVENERTRISHDIHDSILQEMGYCALAISEADCDDKKRGAIAQTLRGSMQELRTLCSTLIPPAFEHVSLLDELNSFCISAGAASGIECRFSVGEGVNTDGFTPEKKLCIYRIVQEAVNNAVKHASPHEIVVSMRIEETNRMFRQNASSDYMLVCFITDDGTGFDYFSHITEDEPAGACVGLRSMRLRANIIGAILFVDSTVEAGTCIRVDIPL